jgi:imidazolonepropionase-like amidohydrolase
MGGANALGIANEVGNFTPGKDADIVVSDTMKKSVSAVYLQGTRVYPF